MCVHVRTEGCLKYWLVHTCQFTKIVKQRLREGRACQRSFQLGVAESGSLDQVKKTPDLWVSVKLSSKHTLSSWAELLVLSLQLNFLTTALLRYYSHTIKLTLYSVQLNGFCIFSKLCNHHH